jgi:D-lactate dehydrogenase
MYEPVTFMKLFLAPYLEFEQKKGHVALHVPCTSKQAGLTDNFVQLASKCSQDVSLTGAGSPQGVTAVLP